ncbi:MAG TPA: DNA-formamidopyrimidine glycosylase family protein [Vicinamibacteria bacterium]|nr:DNA-formamidopyrimidine glycosylase family protein [Vicinamibacteria bacterium]
MPELPDLTAYVEALDRFIGGRAIESIRQATPFLVRTWDPPLSAASGRRVTSVERIAKRIVIGVEGDLFLVIHLMIAGRFHWKKRGAAIARRTDHLALDFDHGSLFLTEASTKKRASLYVVQGRAALRAHDPGGVEPLLASRPDFKARLLVENHTVKRSLTDPRLFAGIGNAYSDEILHRAKLSPLVWTRRLDDHEISRLHDATVSTLGEWCERLRAQWGERFPEKVTAFHPDLAVHGKAKRPCPACATPVQKIKYADNECNYCPACQTGGKLLADRGLSRLLKDDWPKSREEMEEWKTARRSPP